jgi:ankyrin repeat protein
MFKYIIDNIKLLDLDDILILLIKNGVNLQFFDYLIKNGANINCYNGKLLSYSCLYLKLNIIKYFVKNGAVVSNNNYDALFNAIMRNNLELVNFLLEKDEIKTFNDGSNNNCLSYAINWEYNDIALLLISHGFDIKQLDTKSEKIKTFLNELRKNKLKNIYEKTTDI